MAIPKEIYGAPEYQGLNPNQFAFQVLVTDRSDRSTVQLSVVAQGGSG